MTARTEISEEGDVAVPTYDLTILELRRWYARSVAAGIWTERESEAVLLTIRLLEDPAP